MHVFLQMEGGTPHRTKTLWLRRVSTTVTPTSGQASTAYKLPRACKRTGRCKCMRKGVSCTVNWGRRQCIVCQCCSCMYTIHINNWVHLHTIHILCTNLKKLHTKLCKNAHRTCTDSILSWITLNLGSPRPTNVLDFLHTVLTRVSDNLKLHCKHAKYLS